ncbi:MAG: hypothetical protein ABW252_00155 [Polyangiales bacterium]
MSLASKGWVAMTCLLLSAGGGCVKGDSIENDDESSTSKSDDDDDGDDGDTVRDAGSTRRDASSGSSTTRRDAGSSSSNDDDDTGDDADDEGGDDMSLPDGGSGSGRDAGGGSAPMIEIAGTAPKAKCTSTTAAKGGMCSSHFCGITEEQLGSAMSPSSPCGTAALACEQGAVLAKKVTDCSITTKAMASNLGKSNAQLRPLVQDCVFEDEEIKSNTNEECLGCFLNVAECAGDKCLTECLVGTPAQCDACRISKGCEEPLFDCAGLPNPL